MRHMDHLDLLHWGVAWNSPTCRLGPLRGVAKEGQITYNQSRAEGFPSDASFRMSDNFPDDTLLADRLVNQSSMTLVSERVVELLRSEPIGPVEYLRVTIFDHRDRPVDQPFFIVNPLDPVDCLDIEASGAVWNQVLPDKILDVKSLVLDPDRVDRARHLFTCQAYHRALLVSRTLVARMQTAGLTGNQFVELSDYRS